MAIGRLGLRADGRLTEITVPLEALADGRWRNRAREGLNQGGDKVRTKVRRALKDQTGVRRYGTIVEKTDSVRAGAALEYRILGKGKGLPIREFRVSARTGSGVNASPWNVARTFKRSFKTKARGLLKARLGAERFPIRSLYGPAIAKEIVKDRSVATFQQAVRTDVLPIVLRKLSGLFGG